MQKSHQKKTRMRPDVETTAAIFPFPERNQGDAIYRRTQQHFQMRDVKKEDADGGGKPPPQRFGHKGLVLRCPYPPCTSPGVAHDMAGG